MQFRRIYLLILALSALSSGCVSSNMMAIGGNTYPPRPGDYIIDVFVTTDAPVQVQKEIPNPQPLSAVPSNATEIGRIDTNGAPAASWGAVIKDAKQKARSLGGDGIVIKSWGQPMTAVDAYGQTYYGKALSMTVIRYRP